jgi:hypothetical protein
MSRPSSVTMLSSSLLYQGTASAVPEGSIPVCSPARSAGQARGSGRKPTIKALVNGTAEAVP